MESAFVIAGVSLCTVLVVTLAWGLFDLAMIVREFYKHK